MKCKFTDLSQKKTLAKALGAGICEVQRKNTSREVVDSALLVNVSHLNEDDRRELWTKIGVLLKYA